MTQSEYPLPIRAMSKQTNIETIPVKIRKRGCSSSPSSSSKQVYNYRFKRAIMVGKTRVGGGSRSSTPAPSWRMTSSVKPKVFGSSGVESPNHEGGGGGPGVVSARKLAATLWEMNEMPSPKNLERRSRRREKEVRSVTSERMERSGTGSHHMNSIACRHRNEANNGEVLDSHSNASLMEIETKSRAPTPNGSVNGVKPLLKEVSSALTTSKELLKIIHRMWAHDNLPSSSMSLVSALHSELERARLQVNHIIKDQNVDNTEVSYLLKCFAEEKALWKSKERRAIDSAIESIAGELEAEKKLRRRSESLNKKLGQELAETKASFAKVFKELESEKRAREIMEQVCEELAVDIGEDRAAAEELKRESVKVHEEVEKEREMLQLADKLREERVQMKLAEAKHQFEEKNALVDKLRSQLETVLGSKIKGKIKGRKDEDLMMLLRKSNFSGNCLNEEHDDGEVEDVKDSGKSDHHSIELHGQNFHKNLVNCPVNGLVNGKASRKSTCSIQRSISDGNEWGIQKTFVELEKQTPRRSHGDDLQRHKSVKGLRDRILTSLKSRDFDDSGQWSGSKSRCETFNGRRSKK